MYWPMHGRVAKDRNQRLAFKRHRAAVSKHEYVGNRLLPKSTGREASLVGATSLDLSRWEPRLE